MKPSIGPKKSWPQTATPIVFRRLALVKDGEVPPLRGAPKQRLLDKRHPSEKGAAIGFVGEFRFGDGAFNESA